MLSNGRFLRALAGCTLAMALAMPAGAQLRFAVSTDPMPLVRAQGLTEVTAAVHLRSANSAATLESGGGGGFFTFQIFYNTGITNAASAPTTPAASLVNSNGTLTAGGITVEFANLTFLRGRTALTWARPGVNSVAASLTLEPGSAVTFGSGDTPARITVRGVRVNAAALGTSFAASFGVLPAFAALASSAGGPLLLGPALFSVGYLADALVYTGGAGVGTTVPAVAPKAATFAADTISVNVGLTEGFSGAFTSAADEQARSGMEARSGTRFDLTFSNTAPGSYVLAPQMLREAGLELTLVVNGVPLPGATPGVTTRVDSSAGGTLTVTYEVTSTPAARTGVMSTIIPLSLAPAGSPMPVLSVRLGPVSTVTLPSPAAPIPRFVDGFPLTKALALSATDLVFRNIENGGGQQQDVQARVTGHAGATWQAAVSIPGGGNWLTLLASQGSASLDPSAGTPLRVVVNPAGLRAGDYQGLVSVSAAGAANSPQVVAVHLQVAGAASAPVPALNPTGLVFTAVEGGATPQPQTLRIENAGGGALSYTVAAATDAGGAWLLPAASSGSAPATAAIGVDARNLRAGVYSGRLNFNFGSAGIREAAVLLIITRGGTAVSGGRQRLAADCAVTELRAVSLVLPNGFSSVTGWPIPLLLQVVDNCGTAIVGATVTAAFNDAGTIPLPSLLNGTYGGTWAPAVAQRWRVVFRARAGELREAVTELSGTVVPTAASNPVVFAGGAVNAASFDAGTPVTPGSIISIFGANLAPREQTAASFPLPTTLEGVTVKIGGREAPLFYVSPGQINALIPWELGRAPAASLVATAGARVAPPAQLLLNTLRPGLFFVDRNGARRGAVLDQNGSFVDASNPAAPGTVVQVFGTGFGPTFPAIATGQAAPSSPLSYIDARVTATVGGQPARIEFAGLAPGFAGLYQINLVVPSGVTPGDQPLIIAAEGVPSNEVVLAVR